MKSKGMVFLRNAFSLPCLLLLLAACQSSTENRLLQGSGTTLEDPAFYPSDNYLRNAKVSFKNADYGNAEASYRKAVDLAPNDPEAWLGLAATYDQLRRFDLADTAYSKVLQLASTNATILNNAGYSKMLRGDYKSARVFLMKAYELDPNNPYINNNIALLGESQKSIKRAAL